MTFDGSNDMKRAFVEWLEKDAPQINNYQWKEWSDELTEKVNTNLATFTSSYSAPRTTVAKAKETIANIADTSATTANEDTRTSSVDDFDLPEGNASEDDDAWVDSILNS
jgi:hypothetical protein